jgi:hypothetical protein
MMTDTLGHHLYCFFQRYLLLSAIFSDFDFFLFIETTYNKHQRTGRQVLPNSHPVIVAPPPLLGLLSTTLVLMQYSHIENYIKETKCDFGMERLPAGTLVATPSALALEF